MKRAKAASKRKQSSKSTQNSKLQAKRLFLRFFDPFNHVSYLLLFGLTLPSFLLFGEALSADLLLERLRFSLDLAMLEFERIG